MTPWRESDVVPSYESIQEVITTVTAGVRLERKIQDLMDSMDDSERAQAQAELYALQHRIAQAMIGRLDAMMDSLIQSGTAPRPRTHLPAALPDAPETKPGT